VAARRASGASARASGGSPEEVHADTLRRRAAKKKDCGALFAPITSFRFGSGGVLARLGPGGGNFGLPPLSVNGALLRFRSDLAGHEFMLSPSSETRNVAVARLLPVAVLLLVSFVAGCGGGPGGAAAPIPEGPRPGEAPPTTVPDSLRAVGPDTLAPEVPVPVPVPTFDSWADSLLSTLSLREKAAQLMMPWVLSDFAPEGSPSYQRIVEMVEEQGVGGVILSVGSPTEAAAKLNELQSRASVPLLVGADLERGAGYRFRGAVYLPGAISLGGATEFPSLMAVGATGDETLAREMGRITAREARALGIHTPFAPVLDVNNNPDNPIINVRSFGEDPHEVARLGRAFIVGAQEEGVIATGKHFPGHGDTETDSHLDLPVIRVARERLEAVELLPFRAAIDAGLGGIMTAHVTVPNLNGGGTLPATLSKAVLTDLLREGMGFQGIVFTDAMDMFAIDRRFPRGEATVRAVEAGADVILMPPDVGLAVQALVEAVEEGRLTEDRLDQSVLRVLRAKEKVGVHLDREVPIREVSRRVGIPSHEAVAQEIAERSLTLLKNERNLLPLLGTRSARVFSVTFRRASDLLAGRFFNAGLRARYPRLVTAELDRNTPPELYRALRQRARASDLVVVSLYVSVVTSSGSVAIPEEMAEFIQELARANRPHVVISFGSPYLLSEFPDAQAYLLAWSGTEVTQKAAARALFGEIPIQGRTPTRIPPLFEIGDGIQLPPREGSRDD
jgi:beta-N-acetylhexosaminidase